YSNPGSRTPGRATGPIPRNRISDPNARGSRPGVRTSNPNAPGSQPGVRGSRPPGYSTQPPRSSKAGLFVGLGVAVVLVIAGVAFVLVRNAQQSDDRSQVRLAKLAADKAKPQEEDQTPVFLSIVADPVDAEVAATWKDGGEKKGQAPLSFEVPKNAKVHFEFTKPGFVGYSMDIIADQAQNVKAALKAAPVPENAEEKARPTRKQKEKKEELPSSKDGVIDLDDALK